MRAELRRGTLPPQTQERIALAVAEYRGSAYDVATHARAARNLGLSLDEIDLARQFSSRDEREQALLRYLEVLLENRGQVPVHLHEEAREHGWSDEQLLEALGHVALGDFSALVTLAGEVPLEGTSREVKPLGKAA
jgi:AhpD family alkylhydroperoxidase